MGTLIKPTSTSLEKWMRMDVGGLTLFTFSGYAHFGDDIYDAGNVMVGTGDNDTAQQLQYVDYDITDLIVGPHWTAVRQMCPSVTAASHDQAAPDEADGMGYKVNGIKKVNLVDQGGFHRIELQVSCSVAGGFDPAHKAWGRIPSFAYRVMAWGDLADPIGGEGVFWGDPDF
jgi:hypothetical protein